MLWACFTIISDLKHVQPPLLCDKVFCSMVCTTIMAQPFYLKCTVSVLFRCFSCVSHITNHSVCVVLLTGMFCEREMCYFINCKCLCIDRFVFLFYFHSFYYTSKKTGSLHIYTVKKCMLKTIRSHCE